MAENNLVPVFSFGQIAARETEWLWYPYIPLGKVTIIQGDPGEGKSTLALNIAAAVSMGMDFPENKTVVRCGDVVIYQNAEDGLNDTVKPRLERARADCDMILTIDETQGLVSFDDDRLRQAIQQYRPKLVILDPLQAYLGSCVDMHRANEVRPLMTMLAAIAEESGAAIVLIGHLNKAYSMGKSIYRGLGSIDLTAAARSVLLVARDPEHPENRVILQIKNSLAPEGVPVAFTIDDDSRFQFLGEYDIKPSALLSGSEPKRPESQMSRAKKLILEWLDKEDPLYIRDIYGIADSEGISKDTLMKAKQQLQVQSEKTEKGWIWKKPSYYTK